MPADKLGIDREYEDAFRQRRAPPQATIKAIQDAMGANAAREQPRSRTLVIRRGDAPVVGAGKLVLEDGSSRTITGQLPADVPLGYHELSIDGEGPSRRLIVSPGACPLPVNRHSWAWAVQLYATRSAASWGIGDLADLRELARWSKELGAGMLMINPLHAAAPVIPQEASPYFPTSRRFRNPLYLRVEEIAGADRIQNELHELGAIARALNVNRRIDRDAVFRLKCTACERIFAEFPGDDEFDRYLQQMGEPLIQYATFCALAEVHGRDYRAWPGEFHHPHGPAVADYRRHHELRVRYHCWLQWLVERQLEAASRELPIMQDLAVGFDPGGADAWAWQDCLAPTMSVGAPSDLHNPWGQDWGLPPFVPHKLDEARFEPFIQTIRSALAHAGGLRIDHAMGLFRLFWIPRGESPSAGTYVNYPAQALLDIVALESHRAGAFIVAEDLGTVQEHMRLAFMQHQMLSYRLLWLEDARPETYPERSLAAVTTHDLFTVAGLWSGSDFRSQQAIGLAPHRESVDEVMSRLDQMISLPANASLSDVVLAVHRLLAEANSMVIAATLEDALLVEERPNMPGTSNQWPNWRIALPSPIEDIQRRELPRQIAEILGRRGTVWSGRSG